MALSSSYSSSSSWSDLLPELMDTVFHSLNDARDILSCATVCSSWRYSSSAVYSSKFVPLLFVSHPSSAADKETQFSDHFRVLSLDNLVFSGNDQRWICGSTGGCLLTLNVSFHFERLLQFQAISPHSGALTLIKEFVKKAVASKSLLDSDWVVLIIYSTDGGKLGFCRRGDKQWTGLESADHIDDIVFCNGVFLAMDRTGVIYQCELNPNDPKAVPLCTASPFRYDPCKKYFAESDNGKLWVVLQKLDVSEDFDFTTYFEIYEFNSETKEWTTVRSLRGKALFLSPQGRCVAVLAGEAGTGGFVKDDSIYFIDGSPSLGPLNLSVFEWESKQVKKLLHQSRYCSLMFWVTPADVLQR
ncbi:putative F-box protein At5g55150 isoform X2 [Raphanus sativus]|uniref:F-box protein At5g55150 isoform X2 n=1 Tax=Raphanus sativus TaxID=3726 RepID=A0A9W3D460_RAPSA|nr:putative F-box protein At5g55150 isoform X2 [Raphanus sativus]